MGRRECGRERAREGTSKEEGAKKGMSEGVTSEGGNERGRERARERICRDRDGEGERGRVKGGKDGERRERDIHCKMEHFRQLNIFCRIKCL